MLKMSQVRQSVEIVQKLQTESRKNVEKMFSTEIPHSECTWYHVEQLCTEMYRTRYRDNNVENTVSYTYIVLQFV